MLISAVASAQNNFINPTTTLAAQTNNNTSAANSFGSQSNGNLGANNVSKVDVHSLLYAGANTKVFAHLLLWFGDGGHMNIGYNSDSSSQVHAQITDMISRGINGVVIDWYGPNNSIDNAAQLVMAEAESHPGFTFAIMVDKGAVPNGCSGCSAQQSLIDNLQYVEQKYFSSAAYYKQNGQPVVTEFGLDDYNGIDWNAVNAALSTHPLFIFQNNSGFTHTLSGGSFSWVMPTTSDYGMSYMGSFYDSGLSHSNEQTVGASYKGFNDTLASWGSHRIMGQQCGATWLQTFDKANSLYNSGKQLPYLQLVTWNDYEEGTEIESGIDDCFSLSGSVSGNALSWNVSGNEDVVDHYEVYISSDGQNLMSLNQTFPGERSTNLCSFSVPPGNYKLFVQAVGKPSFANRITPAISYTSTCAVATPAPPPSPAPTLNLAASPNTIILPSGKSGNLAIQLQAQSGSYNNPVSLTCTNLPANLKCTFSPAALTPGSGTAQSTLTISQVSTTAGNLPDRKWSTIYASLLFPLGIGGFIFMTDPKRRKSMRGLRLLIFLGLLATVTMGTISCGGGAGATSAAVAAKPPAASRYSVTIQGNASAVQIATTVTVTVE